jgi:hypothetical protein
LHDKGNASSAREHSPTEHSQEEASTPHQSRRRYCSTTDATERYPAFSAAFDATREPATAAACLAGMRSVVRVAGCGGVALEALRDASLQCLVRATALEGALHGGLQPKHEEAVRALLEVRPSHSRLRSTRTNVHHRHWGWFFPRQRS